MSVTDGVLIGALVVGGLAVVRWLYRAVVRDENRAEQDGRAAAQREFARRKAQGITK